MKQTLLFKKATRIEGNATIHVEVDQQRVQAARFMVEDFRGFEKLCQGKAIAHIPHIISRICGLCCTAHQVASVRAIEDALEVEVPAAIRSIRQAAVYGEWIASHAISYFFLTQPDFLGTKQGIFGLIKQHPEIAEVAFSIQKAGSRMVEILGGRAVHAIAIQSGGVAVRPTSQALGEIVAIAERVADQSGKMLSRLDRKPPPGPRIAFPRHSRVNFLCYNGAGRTPGSLEVYDRDGRRADRFDISEFEDHVAEMRVDWSLAKFPYLARRGFPDGIFHVGPLARAFMADSAINMPPLQHLDVVQRARASKGVHIDHIDVMRLAEIFWAATEIKKLLTGIDPAAIASVDIPSAESGKGIGIVEAPRGVLIHSYTINRGRIERLKLLVATQFNNPLINLIIKDLAEHHLDQGELTEFGREAIGRCIRLFDPCLTCATH
jgi:coenzyme F420-reducing hydrogenase alpha subunit